MQPDQKVIAEFKEIYHQEFGIRLSDEAATDKATSLLNLFKVILKIPYDLTDIDERGINED